MPATHSISSHSAAYSPLRGLRLHMTRMNLILEGLRRNVLSDAQTASEALQRRGVFLRNVSNWPSLVKNRAAELENSHS